MASVEDLDSFMNQLKKDIAIEDEREVARIGAERESLRKRSRRSWRAALRSAVSDAPGLASAPDPAEMPVSAAAAGTTRVDRFGGAWEWDLAISHEGRLGEVDWPGVNPPDTRSVVAHMDFYPFTPDHSTKNARVAANVYFYGFTILQAANKPLPLGIGSAYAEVSAEVIMELYTPQQTHYRSKMALKRWGTNVNLAERFDKRFDLLFNGVPLTKGVDTVIRIRTRFKAEAIGYGSYAELNFRDGSGNNMFGPDAVWVTVTAQ